AVCHAVESDAIGDEVKEPVLYLPSNPQIATLVDALPLRATLDVDDDGQWVSYESVWQILWYSLAWIGILAHVVYGLLRLLNLL
ncbi:MAG: hypothetical protein DRI48_07650, partial [Chloroflexi bacterium]